MCEALGLALSRGQHSWLAEGWVLAGGGVQAHGTGEGQAGEAQLPTPPRPEDPHKGPHTPGQQHSALSREGPLRSMPS